MSFTIGVRPGERIIWEVWDANFKPEVDAEASTQSELKILNASHQPMVLVVDLRQVLTTLEDIIYTASHCVPEELTGHPQLCRMILITTSAVIAKSAEGMNSEAFGFIKFDVAASEDEALTLARRLLA
ncbi:MAG TPA: hypothetical protein VHP83_03505 [Aggregatilineaceae bacterium]|nr:hypothetical protein [Aggregatilineaceae bacterium]